MATTTKTKKPGSGITAEEKAAMRELVKERRRNASAAEEAAEVLEKINAMAPSDRAMAKKVHAIIKSVAPELAPKTWYGMPAYYKDGKVICYFQDAAKFKSRYATLGFSDAATLDDGAIWPVAYAVSELNPADEARISALVKKAAR
jgi:uncharacterized protein YdhG (YjbR/CyaY superfamily)